MLAVTFKLRELWIHTVVHPLWDQVATAKAGAIFAITLGFAFVGTASQIAPSFEELRSDAVATLRAIHLVFIAFITGVFWLLVRTPSEPVMPWQSCLVTFGVFGSAQIVNRVPFTGPGWMPALLFLGAQLTVGLDGSTHAFRTWAIWIMPTGAGSAINAGLAGAGAFLWLSGRPASARH